MNTIHVPTGRPYDVCIRAGSLPELGEKLVTMGRRGTVAVISDDTVFPLYGETLCRSLAQAGFRVVCHIIPAGEEHKNLTVYAEVLEFLAREHLTRSDLLAALGGGVVGDLTGFAAATYLRGLDYIQIPTTLLAAVDSSVGGKTAVDLSVGKNLAGAFHQPSLVWCDPALLSSLPESVFRDGCAEVIKYGLLGDAAFFQSLSELPIRQQLERVITRCVEMKRDIVADDELDRGRRQLLNLGHTFGHAMESCSGYQLSHGQCVAMGMALITRSAASMGLCPASLPGEVEALLISYGLPTSVPFGAEVLAQAALSDKKRSGARLHLVVPHDLGDCRLVDVPADGLLPWLRAGGAA